MLKDKPVNIIDLTKTSCIDLAFDSIITNIITGINQS